MQIIIEITFRLKNSFVKFEFRNHARFLIRMYRIIFTEQIGKVISFLMKPDDSKFVPD